MAKLADITPEQALSLITKALEYEGKDYYKGGGSDSSPDNGFDCSGLVWYVINQAGFTYAYAATATIPHHPYLRRLQIPPEALRAGDLMLFASHVGFYDPNPPKAGKTLYSATTSHGVRYENPKYFGSVTGYYRLQVIA